MKDSDSYARIAPWYDVLTRLPLRPLHAAMCEIAAGGGERVLDVCCGTGVLLGMLARRGVRAAGTDASPAMLARARRRLGDGARLALGDARNLNFKDSSFDAASICLALHENKPGDAARILAQSRRVVRPGGHVLVADYLAPRTPGSRLALAAASPVERAAGCGHYANWRVWIAAGGLEAALACSGLAPSSLRSFYAGTVGLALCPV